MEVPGRFVGIDLGKRIYEKNMVNKKIKEITCKKHEEFERIHLLNGIELRNELYKYMPLERLLNSIEKKELVFVSPKLWADPCELKFYETDYSYFGFSQPELFCMCMTDKKNENQAAAWKMYSNPYCCDCVRISFYVDQLLKNLNFYAESYKKEIYIGKVIYGYSIDEINEIVNKDDEKFKIFFPEQFSIQHYLTLMCLKRKPFAFENEVRIFIIDSDQNIEKKDGKILSVSDFKYSTKLIKEVKLSPLTPFSNNDFRKKFYKQKQSFEFKSIKKELQNRIENINVTYSKLYSDVKKIEKVPKE